MREILFRAKRADNGRWIEGYYMYHLNRMPSPVGDGIKPEDEEHIILYDNFADWNMPREITYAPVYKTTVGQYIGMRDRTGKRIFEDDVVKIAVTHFEGYGTRCVTGAMKYDSAGNLGVVIEYIDNIPVWSDILYELNLSGDIEDYSFEVLGNIHDNPELLKRY